MPTVPTGPGATSGRVRIAIASPEILDHIRREFASKGLAVQIDGLPSVDVTVTPATTGAAPATGALADAMNGLAGPHSRRRDPATARYRLALVPHGRPDTAHGGAPPGPERPPLSPREAEVMDSISRGMRNGDIAALLQVEPKTVKNHVNRIFTKLGAGSRVEAVLIWQRTRAAP